MTVLACSSPSISTKFDNSSINRFGHIHYNTKIIIYLDVFLTRVSFAQYEKYSLLLVCASVKKERPIGQIWAIVNKKECCDRFFVAVVVLFYTKLLKI